MAVELIHDETNHRTENDDEITGKQKQPPTGYQPDDIDKIDAHESVENVAAVKAIQLLSDANRWVLIDRAVEGRRFREIGDLLNVTRARAHQRFKRALETVRAAVKVA